MDCIADKILHPSQPQEDAPAAGGGNPRTITIITRQAATLYDLVRLVAYLADSSEEAQCH